MISDSKSLLRLLLGARFGGSIGFERQHHGRPAGSRTHLLVRLASVLGMIVSKHFHNPASHDPSCARVDQGRIASGAVTGLALGGGLYLAAGAALPITLSALWLPGAAGQRSWFRRYSLHR